MGLVKEFKEFAMRGNVMDMAVGVIMGGAFGKIVSSLVDDVLMPFIGMLTGGIDLSGLKYEMMLPAVDGGEPIAGATLKYGMFIQNIIDFLIIALCIFFMIKAMNKLMPKKEEPEAPAGPTQEELLTDIRDLLKDKK
jgi:large conductance mechanosensitive channel